MQLSYQPAFDPYHAVYRFLRLRETVLNIGPLHEDHLKILDFYLLFPFRIEGLRLKQAHRKYRRLASKYNFAKPYGDLPEDRALFSRMEALQSAALDTLASKNLIDGNLYKSGTVDTTTENPPAALIERLYLDNTQQEDLISFLEVLAGEYELLGVDGLKDRSRLMEYRYDAI